MTNASEYNEQIVGTIDFIISYDKEMIPTHDIANLVDDITQSLNEQYAVLRGNNFDIQFNFEGCEDQRWQELNGLIKVAWNRLNSKVKPFDVIRNNLTPNELSRFNILTQRITKEASNE